VTCLGRIFNCQHHVWLFKAMDILYTKADFFMLLRRSGTRVENRQKAVQYATQAMTLQLSEQKLDMRSKDLESQVDISRSP
jgi:hypothetical protein